MADPDWVRWHDPYDQPGSSLDRRLRIVKERVREALTRAPGGEIRVISMCAGQGRDLLEVLPDHARRRDVRARLVELDERNVSYGRRLVDSAGLEGVDFALGDASLTTAYQGFVPADVVLVCGVFGNISPQDIRFTISELKHLVRVGATVIWTRHRRAPDLTPAIRGWFGEEGFDELSFDAADEFLFGVGTNRLVGDARPFRPGVHIFNFVGNGEAANL